MILMIYNCTGEACMFFKKSSAKCEISSGLLKNFQQ